MKNLNELGVQEMDAIEMKKTDGGTTSPTYDLKDNYEAHEDWGAFFGGFFKGLLGL